MFLKKRKQILKNVSKKELRDSTWFFLCMRSSKNKSDLITQPSRKKPK